MAQERFKSVKRPPAARTESSGSVFRSLPRMPNGGYIVENNSKVSINNCCGMDCVTFCLYAMYKTVLPVRDFIKNQSIINHKHAILWLDVFKHLDKSDFVKARTVLATKLVPQLRSAGNSFYGEWTMPRV
jgi:hypothetical protein